MCVFIFFLFSIVDFSTLNYYLKIFRISHIEFEFRFVSHHSTICKRCCTQIQLFCDIQLCLCCFCFVVVFEFLVELFFYLKKTKKKKTHPSSPQQTNSTTINQWKLIKQQLLTVMGREPKQNETRRQTTQQYMFFSVFFPKTKNEIKKIKKQTSHSKRKTNNTLSSRDSFWMSDRISLIDGAFSWGLSSDERVNIPRDNESVLNSKLIAKLKLKHKCTMYVKWRYRKGIIYLVNMLFHQKNKKCAKWRKREKNLHIFTMNLIFSIDLVRMMIMMMYRLALIWSDRWIRFHIRLFFAEFSASGEAATHVLCRAQIECHVATSTDQVSTSLRASHLVWIPHQRQFENDRDVANTMQEWNNAKLLLSLY